MDRHGETDTCQEGWKLSNMNDGKITITLVQPDVVWEDIEKNLANYTRLLDSIDSETDLVLLPEMFSTGFTLEPDPVAEEPDARTMQWMKHMAGKLGCAIAGSLVIRQDSRFYNRLVCMQDNGVLGTYDKRHLFMKEGEGKHYEPGKRKLILLLKGWRINFQICYDLRFPVWSRNRDDYDMTVYVANWPAVRSSAWNTLLKARAIENQSFVIGVNRTGRDGNGILYKGATQVVGPKGNVMLNLGPSINQVATLTLSIRDVQQFREKFPVWCDRDAFELR